MKGPALTPGELERAAEQLLADVAHVHAEGGLEAVCARVRLWREDVVAAALVAAGRARGEGRTS